MALWVLEWISGTGVCCWGLNTLNVFLFPSLLWSLEIGHNGSFYTTDPENALSWDIFCSWRAVIWHLPVHHWIWTNPWCRSARGKGVYIHRGRGQEKASGDSNAMHCLGVLSRVMLVPQHVGVKHSLHSLEDVVGGTGSNREVSRQGARSKLRIEDSVPKKVSLEGYWEREERL